MLVQAVERFKQAGLDVNLPEIFVWYFEQKGVENAERFLGLGVNGVNGDAFGANSINLPLLQMLAQNLMNKPTDSLKETQDIQHDEVAQIIDENKQ